MKRTTEDLRHEHSGRGAGEGCRDHFLHPRRRSTAASRWLALHTPGALALGTLGLGTARGFARPLSDGASTDGSGDSPDDGDYESHDDDGERGQLCTEHDGDREDDDVELDSDSDPGDSVSDDDEDEHEREDSDDDAKACPPASPPATPPAGTSPPAPAPPAPAPPAGPGASCGVSAQCAAGLSCIASKCMPTIR